LTGLSHARSLQLLPLAITLLVACANTAVSADLIGQASVIEGDTLEIHGTRIPLWGIDAPESSQLCRGEDSLQYRCGAKAANDLYDFITKRTMESNEVIANDWGTSAARARMAKQRKQIVGKNTSFINTDFLVDLDSEESRRATRSLQSL
jgi:hypothetical protein